MKCCFIPLLVETLSTTLPATSAGHPYYPPMWNFRIQTASIQVSSTLSHNLHDEISVFTLDTKGIDIDIQRMCKRYLCMYACIGIHTHTNVHTYLRTYLPYVRTYVSTYLRTYIHAHLHTYVYMHTQACMHARTHAHTHTYIIKQMTHTLAVFWYLPATSAVCQIFEVVVRMSSILSKQD